MINITNQTKLIDKMQAVVNMPFYYRQTYRTKVIFDYDECRWLNDVQAMFFCSKKNLDNIIDPETIWIYSPYDITYEKYWDYRIEIHFPNIDDELYYKLKWL